MKENARVLVVDDEPMVGVSLTNWLKEENYSVKAVCDGPSAIIAVRDESWDIVLLVTNARNGWYPRCFET
jgi:DNA-binding response OmpR family regulator